jgi:hypothetical protein
VHDDDLSERAGGFNQGDAVRAALVAAPEPDDPRRRPSRMPRLLALSALAALAALLTACGGQDDPTAADLADATVTVHFHDSSVPPEHHRSWEVVLDAERMSLLVDSYGTEVARAEEPMDAADWDAFVETLAETVVGLESAGDGDGCGGGTSIDLVIDGAGDADRTITASPCGDDAEARDAAERIEAVVEPFRDDLGLDAAVAT